MVWKTLRRLPNLMSVVLDFLLGNQGGNVNTEESREAKKDNQLPHTAIHDPDQLSWTRPRCSAVVTAWVRSLTFSLSKTIFKWFLTVFSERFNEEAISLLLFPLTRICNTSVS